MRRRAQAPALLAVLACLALLAASCSSDEPTERERAGGETRAGGGAGSAGKSAAEPLVPIVHLTSTRQSVSEGELSRKGDLLVPRGVRRSAAELLERPDLEASGSTREVIERVSHTPDALGIVPWSAVGPRVKALAVDGEDLLDPDTGSEAYPLRPGSATGPDPGELRRVVVGGDIVLDRGQNYAVIQQGRGIDFPLDGGYAAITGRVAEPSSASEYGVIHQFTAERRGEAGAMREYLRSADLTLANFENPVVRAAVYHPDAPTFTGDLRLLPILEQAGIDGVTLGNNHILDAGAQGLEETLGHLDDAGIAYTGAGMDLAAAREPMTFELGETKVGVLNYQGVPSYDWAWATESAPGTAPMRERLIVEDIRRLRPEVDLLVVMPHWGNEYLASPEPDQVDLAHAIMDAGADVIVGDHAHWAKGMEIYKGKPIYYGTGNFLFDQSWSEETSTGIFAEITLYEDRVLQTEPVPFVVLDMAQPNFLLPEAGGDRALRRIFSASIGPEFEALETEQR